MEPLVSDLYFLEGSTEAVPHIYTNVCDNGKWKPAPHILDTFAPYLPDIEEVLCELELDIGALRIEELPNVSAREREGLAEYMDDIHAIMCEMKTRRDILISWLHRGDDDSDDDFFPEPYQPDDPSVRRPVPSPITSA